MKGYSYAGRRRLVQDSGTGSDEYDDGNDGDGNNSRIGDLPVTSDHSRLLCTPRLVLRCWTQLWP